MKKVNTTNAVNVVPFQTAIQHTVRTAARHGLDDLMVRQDTGGCGCAVDRDTSDHSDLLMDERRRR